MKKTKPKAVAKKPTSGDIDVKKAKIKETQMRWMQQRSLGESQSVDSLERGTLNTLTLQ
jgi:hypothetical protein